MPRAEGAHHGWRRARDEVPAAGADVQAAVAVEVGLAHEDARGLVQGVLIRVVVPEHELVGGVGCLEGVGVCQRDHKGVTAGAEAHAAQAKLVLVCVPRVPRRRAALAAPAAGVVAATAARLLLQQRRVGHGARRALGGAAQRAPSPVILPEVQLSPERALAAARGDGQDVAVRVERERHNRAAHLRVGDAGPHVRVPHAHLVAEAAGGEDRRVARVVLDGPGRARVAHEHAVLPQGHGVEDLYRVVPVRRREGAAVVAEGDGDGALGLQRQVDVALVGAAGLHAALLGPVREQIAVKVAPLRRAGAVLQQRHDARADVAAVPVVPHVLPRRLGSGRLDDAPARRPRVQHLDGRRRRPPRWRDEA
mmetsp:Transcript_25416/g.79628  ORF Transcript_25416/g.79628 Transcript_25416/m.79628 type:complete len:365 (-) Transcript_25416:106-1200(-)